MDDQPSTSNNYNSQASNQNAWGIFPTEEGRRRQEEDDKFYDEEEFYKMMEEDLETPKKFRNNYMRKRHLRHLQVKELKRHEDENKNNKPASNQASSIKPKHPWGGTFPTEEERREERRRQEEEDRRFAGGAIEDPYRSRFEPQPSVNTSMARHDVHNTQMEAGGRGSEEEDADDDDDDDEWTTDDDDDDDDRRQRTRYNPHHSDLSSLQPSPSQQMRQPFPAQQMRQPSPSQQTQQPSPAQQMQQTSPSQQMQQPSPAQHYATKCEIDVNEVEQHWKWQEEMMTEELFRLQPYLEHFQNERREMEPLYDRAAEQLLRAHETFVISEHFWKKNLAVVLNHGGGCYEASIQDKRQQIESFKKCEQAKDTLKKRQRDLDQWDQIWTHLYWCLRMADGKIKALEKALRNREGWFYMSDEHPDLADDLFENWQEYA